LLRHCYVVKRDIDEFFGVVIIEEQIEMFLEERKIK